MVSDGFFIPICIAFSVLPTLWLYSRVQTTRRNNEIKVIVVGQANDHRDHILVRLFAMLPSTAPLAATHPNQP
jgi:hypothetical protein